MDNPNQPNNTDQDNNNSPVDQGAADSGPVDSGLSQSPAFPTSTPPESPATPEQTPPVVPSSDGPPVVSQSSDGKKPMGIMIGALLLLIVIFLGLLFFFVFNKPTEPEQPTQQLPVEDLQPSPVVTVSPTPELTEDAIDDIDIGSPEAELSPIQDDLDEL
ncbi:MAG TPA: hypothetical protein PLD54_04270 [Candidatus Levybacteria bacterium]|nr:hypothetical protein [Candidatus Levybacteria bacterium]